ncbi:MAG TPA: GNAT family N-acetyltransferase [Ktedonobacterales bacterium]|nr:GNAT family N-acetyltransferase [Ktedonobacterales bacterium]
MQDLVQRIWSRDANWHIGDLAWQRTSNPELAHTWRTALWEEDGAVMAWGWIELPDVLNLAVDPARPELADAAIAWFEGMSEAERLCCMVLETESHLVSALARAGYTADRDAPYFTHHHMSLDALAAPVTPDGFILRHVRADEAERRAAGHRAAWSDFGPSRKTTETFRAVMAAWPYRPDLDWVVEAPDGAFVATALGWLDEVNRVGLLEPVGCAPAYRRRGFARAVNLATLRAMREAGAESAIVNPRGDEGYPIPGKLYRSIGFQPSARTALYVRQRTQ